MKKLLFCLPLFLLAGCYPPQPEVIREERVIVEPPRHHPVPVIVEPRRGPIVVEPRFVIPIEPEHHRHH